MNNIISIRPSAAAKIYSGEKKFIFREKTDSDVPIGGKVSIREMGEGFAVTGEFTVGPETCFGAPSLIWSHVGHLSQLPFDEFAAFATGFKEVQAIEVRCPVRFDDPMPLIDFGA